MIDISDLDNLESTVTDLVRLAKDEIEQKRLQEKREQFIREKIEQIEKRLRPMLETTEQAIAELDREGVVDSIARQKLVATAEGIRQKLALAPEEAAREAEQWTILQEERQAEERQAQLAERWRTDLKEDLLEMIYEQSDFYSATDASVAVKGYLADLKAIGALEEVVEALIAQINEHSEEGPVAKLRGSHEQTLNFIYTKALENRSRVERPPNVQPSTRHRKTEKRPVLYADLEGKVVVFGGHDRLETAVRNRLRDSNVQLVWYTEQGGLQAATQGESHISNADLVIVVTGYASHSLTEKALDTCRRIGRTPEIVNTTGMTRVLETIETGLKAKLLARHWNQS